MNPPSRPATPVLIPENIPEMLKQLSYWLAWNYELRNGRWTKPPVDAKTGRYADVTNLAHCSAFNTALSVVQRGVAVGIGFVLQDGSGIVGVDGDDKNANPAHAAEIEQLILWLGTYCERSPSGKGLRALMYGNLPVAGIKHDNLEIYKAKRFLTITGNHVAGTPRKLELRRSQIDEIYRVIRERKGSQRSGYAHNNKLTPERVAYINKLANAPVRETTEQILFRARKAGDGDRFKLLWEGNWRALSYPSQSEADLALMNLLSRYTKNANQIVELFHLSALGQREKAYRGDYLEDTLIKVFSRFSPNPHWPPEAETFNANDYLRAQGF